MTKLSLSSRLLIIATFSSATLAMASERATVIGEYVEARTAEVFAGGCIMNSEAETAGREAILAWRISRGSIDGVSLDGLTVVAVVAGDRNLGMREMGGETPHDVRAIVTVDERASIAQRDALVRFAREMSGGLITGVTRVDSAPIRFATTVRQVEVTSADVVTLTVNKEMTHDPSCGAMQWFKPFSSRLTSSAIGFAEAHTFNGDGLGTKWSAPHKRSAFYGTFSY